MGKVRRHAASFNDTRGGRAAECRQHPLRGRSTGGLHGQLLSRRQGRQPWPIQASSSRVMSLRLRRLSAQIRIQNICFAHDTHSRTSSVSHASDTPCKSEDHLLRMRYRNSDNGWTMTGCIESLIQPRWSCQQHTMHHNVPVVHRIHTETTYR